MDDLWEQLLRYVRGDASAKLSKDDFCWLIEAANAKMESMERIAHAALSGETTMQLAARVAELEAAHVEACVSWGLSADEEAKLIDRVAELKAQMAAHERVCAGTWVPVGERLPEGAWVGSGYRPDNGVTNWITYIDGDWVMDADGRYIAPPTHWLDAKLPTSSEEG